MRVLIFLAVVTTLSVSVVNASLAQLKQPPGTPLTDDGEGRTLNARRRHMHAQNWGVDEVDDKVVAYKMHPYYNITRRDGHDHVNGFWDISQKGRLSAASDVDDRLIGPLSLPWPWPFYGHTHQEFYLNPNGFIAFSPMACTTHAFCGWAPGFQESPSYAQYIAPFMTDLNPSALAESTIHTYHRKPGDDGYKRDSFYIQWTRVLLYKDHQLDPRTPNDPYRQDDMFYTFQLVLDVGGNIRFNYKEVDPTNPMTIPLLPYNAKYPLLVGLEDAAIVDNQVVPLLRAELTYDDLRGDGGVSWEFKALRTCLNQRTCTECFETHDYMTERNIQYRVNDTHLAPLECRWCVGAKRCSDGIGREVEEDSDLRNCAMRGNEFITRAQKSSAKCLLANGGAAGDPDHIVLIAILVPLALLVIGLCAYRCFGQNCRRAIVSKQRRGVGKKYAMNTDEGEEDEADQLTIGGGIGGTGGRHGGGAGNDIEDGDTGMGGVGRGDRRGPELGDTAESDEDSEGNDLGGVGLSGSI